MVLDRGANPLTSTNRTFMELIKYRDAGMHTYTYFWIDKNKRCVSPYFDSSSDATDWLESHIDGGVLSIRQGNK